MMFSFCSINRRISWGEIFQNPKLVNAILDRILHHATVVNIVGDSYRLKNHIRTEKKS